MLEQRVGDLERELRGLERRIAAVEGTKEVPAPKPVATPAPARTQVAPRPAPAPERPAPRPRTSASSPEPARRPEPTLAPKARRPRPQVDLEDLVGGRVLAWLGGVAVLVGLAFLMALAISSGWIGEGARTVIGAVAAAGLMGAGIWLHERRGRTDAALASLSSGVAAMFAVAAVATSVYHVLPAVGGLAIGMATGALATWLAVRWESQGIAALGIVGAMIAPAVAGASGDGVAMAVLFVAGVAAVSVLTSQGWRWLSFATVLLALPQWVAFLSGHHDRLIDVVAVLLGFGALGAMAAVGHELRAATDRMSASSGFLLILNALAVGGAGWFALDAAGGRPAAVAGVWTLAVCHAAAAVWAKRRDELPEDLTLLLLSVGTVIADVAFAVSFDGPPRTIGWAATSVAFAALVRRHRRTGGATEPASIGLGVHLTLALIQAVAADATPVLVGHDDPSLAAGGALVVLAAACFVSGRLAEERGTAMRTVLDSVGLIVLGYLTVITMAGLPLVLALVGEALALAGLARRDGDQVALWGTLGALTLGIGFALGLAPTTAFADGLDQPLTAAAALAATAVACVLAGRVVRDAEPELRRLLHAVAITLVGYLTLIELDGLLLVAVLCAEGVALAVLARVREDDVMLWGSLVALGLGLAYAVAIAPPDTLIVGLGDPLAATAALASVALGAVAVACIGAPGPYRDWLLGSAAVVVLYLASVLVVTPFQPDGAAAQATVVDLPVRQQGQVLLSALWALCGAAGIVVGLVRDLRPVRLAALGLVLVAVGKVFLFDLATLTSVYRVASFIALGVLLLAAAFVWQRVRPRAVPDMREVPHAVR